MKTSAATTEQVGERSAPTSIGRTLHDKRRRRRISMARAAEDTRIRRDFLERIEADELTFLAPAYVRAFLATYARYLRLDPAEVVAEFDRLDNAKQPGLSVLARTKRSLMPSRSRAYLVPLAVTSSVLVVLTVLALSKP